MRIAHWILPLVMILTAASPACAAQESAAAPGWLDQLKNPATRVDAEWNLRLEKDARKIPDLLALLKNGDRDLRVTVLQILSESGDSALWKSVAPLLKDGEPSVREASARALASFGVRDSVPYLMDTILEGMDAGNAVTYWVMPSDITDNYRYAAVEALNRIAKQNFKYNRAINNFGRMFWMGKIKEWWKKHKAFYTPAFVALPKTWSELKIAVEKFQAGLPRDVLDNTPGGQEFDQAVKDLKEDVEAILGTLESANTSASEIQERCADIQRAFQTIEEIFVYTPELEPVRPSWQELKAKLAAGCQSLDGFLKK